MFRKLISFETAEKLIRQKLKLKPLGRERALLSDSYSRVLAEDVRASINVPQFDKSSVDGYAVRAEDIFDAEENNPIPLRLCGRIDVGELSKVVVKKGLAAKIVTGAPLPKGANTVVMLEYTQQNNEKTVYICRSAPIGDNVVKVGADIQKGEVVMLCGEKLLSRRVGLAAAIGRKDLEVYKRPRVSILSTGAEIVEQGSPLPPSKIYDVNAHTLSSAVLECGGKPKNLGVVPDEEEVLEETLKSALSNSDCVVTSGSVSVGPKDLLPQILERLGKPGIIFSGISVKPGKPTTVASVEGKPIFSLPGHPTSALLMFYLLVRPCIFTLTGENGKVPNPTKRAVLTRRIFSSKGRKTFVMVDLHLGEEGTLYAAPVPTGLSSTVSTIAKSKGFVEIDEDTQFIDPGEEVAVYIF